MDNQEFAFIQNLLLSGMHVGIHYFQEPYADITAIDHSLRSGLNNSEVWYQEIRDFIDTMRHRRYYIVTDAFLIQYILLLPFEDSRDVISVGPYLDREINDELLVQVQKRTHLDHASMESVRSFYHCLPAFTCNTPLIATLNHIVQRLNPSSAAFQALYHEMWTTEPTQHSIALSEDFDKQLSMAEERFSRQAALMDCVSVGNYEAAVPLLHAYLSNPIAPRIEDSLREHKQLATVANTLYRCAAAKCEVHPYYLYDLSAKYVKGIDQCTSVNQVDRLTEKMLKEYCSLVRSKSLKDYTPNIRRALTYIDFHLTSELSLSVIAEKLHLSPAYLSREFKKELGCTITKYITRQRIQLAAHLMVDTSESIQMIATLVGIPDISYFTKQFKSEMGESPREYRRSRQKTGQSSN